MVFGFSLKNHMSLSYLLEIGQFVFFVNLNGYIFGWITQAQIIFVGPVQTNFVAFMIQRHQNLSVWVPQKLSELELFTGILLSSLFLTNLNEMVSDELFRKPIEIQHPYRQILKLS